MHVNHSKHTKYYLYEHIKCLCVASCLNIISTNHVSLIEAVGTHCKNHLKPWHWIQDLSMTNRGCFLWRPRLSSFENFEAKWSFESCGKSVFVSGRIIYIFTAAVEKGCKKLWSLTLTRCFLWGTWVWKQIVAQNLNIIYDLHLTCSLFNLVMALLH